MMFSYLLALFFSDKESVVIFIVVPMYVICVFSMPAFKIFS